MKPQRYWVQTSPGDYIGATVIPAAKAPKGGHWREITGCLNLCCHSGAGTTTGTDIPRSPANFHVDKGPSGEHDLFWDHVQGADTYLLERAIDYNFTTELTFLQNSPNVIFVDSVIPGVVYYYRLATYIDGEPSAWAYATGVSNLEDV